MRLESTLARWTEFSPPPGTAYNLLDELTTLPNQSKEQRLTTLKELGSIAPYSESIRIELLRATYSTNRSVVEFLEIWGILTNYNLTAMSQAASCLRGTPALYEARLNEIAAIDPWEYVTLGDYVTRHGETNRGMELLQKGLSLCEDRVAASGRALTLVRYHQRNGRDADAKRIAEEAASTYSARGLATMEEYHEFRGELSEAMTWARRSDERYQTLSLFRFCLRNYEKEKDPDLANYMRKQIIRERDKRAVAISRLDRSHPPITGATVITTNENTARYGIGISNVIVGLDGFQVRGAESYTTLRIASGKTNLALVYWDGSDYKDTEVNLPGGKLGVGIRDHVYQQPKR